jgi:hypothetical protein
MVEMISSIDNPNQQRMQEIINERQDNSSAPLGHLILHKLRSQHSVGSDQNTVTNLASPHQIMKFTNHSIVGLNHTT